MYDEDYLIHFGIKGMKWGVRKDKYKSADKATRKKYRDEYKKTDEYKNKVNKAKKVAMVGAGIVAGTLAVSGGSLLVDTISLQITGKRIIDHIHAMQTAYKRTPEYQEAFREYNRKRAQDIVQQQTKDLQTIGEWQEWKKKNSWRQGAEGFADWAIRNWSKDIKNKKYESQYQFDWDLIKKQKERNG